MCDKEQGENEMTTYLPEKGDLVWGAASAK
jgi:hypothetical protein